MVAIGQQEINAAVVSEYLRVFRGDAAAAAERAHIAPREMRLADHDLSKASAHVVQNISLAAKREFGAAKFRALLGIPKEEEAQSLPTDVTFKKCTVCGSMLEANPKNFYRAAARKDGLTSACKSCHNASVARSKEKHSAPTTVNPPTADTAAAEPSILSHSSANDNVVIEPYRFTVLDTSVESPEVAASAVSPQAAPVALSDRLLAFTTDIDALEQENARLRAENSSLREEAEALRVSASQANTLLVQLRQLLEGMHGS